MNTNYKEYVVFQRMSVKTGKTTNYQVKITKPYGLLLTNNKIMSEGYDLATTQLGKLLGLLGVYGVWAAWAGRRCLFMSNQN